MKTYNQTHTFFNPNQKPSILSKLFMRPAYNPAAVTESALKAFKRFYLDSDTLKHPALSSLLTPLLRLFAKHRLVLTISASTWDAVEGSWDSSFAQAEHIKRTIDELNKTWKNVIQLDTIRNRNIMAEEFYFRKLLLESHANESVMIITPSEELVGLLYSCTRQFGIVSHSACYKLDKQTVLRRWSDSPDTFRRRSFEKTGAHLMVQKAHLYSKVYLDHSVLMTRQAEPEICHLALLRALQGRHISIPMFVRDRLHGIVRQGGESSKQAKQALHLVMLLELLGYLAPEHTSATPQEKAKDDLLVLTADSGSPPELQSFREAYGRKAICAMNLQGNICAALPAEQPKPKDSKTYSVQSLASELKCKPFKLIAELLALGVFANPSYILKDNEEQYLRTKHGAAATPQIA